METVRFEFCDGDGVVIDLLSLGGYGYIWSDKSLGSEVAQAQLKLAVPLPKVLLGVGHCLKYCERYPMDKYEDGHCQYIMAECSLGQMHSAVRRLEEEGVALRQVSGPAVLDIPIVRATCAFKETPTRHVFETVSMYADAMANLERLGPEFEKEVQWYRGLLECEYASFCRASKAN